MDKELTGRLIREARVMKGYTQSELGELINVSNKAVSRWENGESFPDVAVLERLSTVLDLQIGEIVTGTADNSAEMKREKKKRRMSVMCRVGALLWYAFLLGAVLLVSKGFGRGSIPMATYVVVLTIVTASVVLFVVAKRSFVLCPRDRGAKVMFVVALCIGVLSLVNCVVTTLFISHGIIPFNMDMFSVGPFVNVPLIVTFAVCLLFISIDFFLVEFTERKWSGYDFSYVLLIFLSLVFTDGLHVCISPNDFFHSIIWGEIIVVAEVAGGLFGTCIVIKYRYKEK